MLKIIHNKILDEKKADNFPNVIHPQHNYLILFNLLLRIHYAHTVFAKFIYLNKSAIECRRLKYLHASCVTKAKIFKLLLLERKVR